MVNLFAIGLSHGLLGLALWRLIFRDDLDVEGAAAKSVVRKPGGSR